MFKFLRNLMKFYCFLIYCPIINLKSQFGLIRRNKITFTVFYSRFEIIFHWNSLIRSATIEQWSILTSNISHNHFTKDQFKSNSFSCPFHDAHVPSEQLLEVLPKFRLSFKLSLICDFSLLFHSLKISFKTLHFSSLFIQHISFWWIVSRQFNKRPTSNMS